MIVKLDRSSDEPPHAQLTRQIVRLIAEGSLEVGMRLPTVRQLASDLGIAPNTIVRCFGDLEAMGLVAMHGRRGTTVAGGFVIAQQHRRTALIAAARTFADLVVSSGTSADEAINAVVTALSVAEPATVAL